MRATLLLLLAAGAAFGQLDSDTITVSASMTAASRFDSAAIQVALTLPQRMQLDDALAIVKGAGFTASDLTSVSSASSSPQPLLYWAFSKTISATDVPGTLAALEQARQNAHFPQSGSDLFYSVNNAASQAPDCVYTALIGDAQAQGRRVAEAAGLKLGSILSISERPQAEAVAYATFTTDVYPVRSGDFSSIVPVGLPASFLLGQISGVPPSTTCSLKVQFALIR